MKTISKVLLGCLMVGAATSCAVYSYAISNDFRYGNDYNPQSYSIDAEADDIHESSSEKYDYLLRNWSDDPEWPDDRNANFPDFYGGAYINDEGELVIQVTSLNEEVISYFADLIDLEHVHFSEVKYSLHELFEAQEMINDILTSNDTDASIRDSINGTGISIENNTVNVYVSSDSCVGPVSILDTYSEYANDLCSIDFVKLDFADWSTEGARIDILEQDLELQNTISGILVQPGAPILLRVGSSSSYLISSVGCWVKDSRGDIGILTAAHDDAYKGQSAFASKTGERPDEYFGTVSTRMFEGAVDAAYVRRDSISFNPITYIDGWDFNLKAASKLMAVGDEIYKRGIGSGVRRGKVRDIYFNPKANDSSGTVQISDAVLTDCVARSMDSGGIVAGGGSTSSRYVAGIISGGVWESSTQEEAYMYYSKVPSILRAFDLTLY